MGRAIAFALSQAGASIAVNDIGESARSVARELGATGKALPVIGDVGDAGQVSRMFNEVLANFGRLDILVNNAGIEIHTPFLDITECEWDRVHRTNLKGVLLCSQHAARAMISGSHYGRIINISSIHEDRPATAAASYAASKGGLRMLTRVMALELAEHKITVNAVAPGAIDTPMNQDLVESAEARNAFESLVPARRIGVPDEVARVVVFLASADASYITGSTYYVDGGLSLKQ
jgi:glucose 1-dehydrogenase